MLSAPSLTGAATITLRTPRAKYGVELLARAELARCTRARSRRRARPRAPRRARRHAAVARAPCRRSRASPPRPLASWAQRPWTESNVSRCAAVAGVAGDLVDVRERRAPGQPHAARSASRPMRPKPLMPTRVTSRAAAARRRGRARLAAAGGLRDGSQHVSSAAGEQHSAAPGLTARTIAAAACSCTRWVSRISTSTSPAGGERAARTPRASARRRRSPSTAACRARVASSMPGSAITSETANRPPGRSTRATSRSTAGLSPERLITQFEITTSTRRVGERDLLDVALHELDVRSPGRDRRSRAPGRASRRSCRARSRGRPAPRAAR